MDDRRVGLIIRALRRRRGWRQVDLAAAAALSQSEISRVELGHLDALSIRAVRAILAALDARLDLTPRWRGGDLDRLVDELHAELAAAVAREISLDGWAVHSEVTFTRVGERGSIDLLAVSAEQRIAAMLEIKSELTSAEETQRRIDVKSRVLASVVEERFGWRPRIVGSFLVLADTSRNRRRLARLGPLLAFGTGACLDTRQSRRWFREPVAPAVGVWFVRLTRGWGSRRGRGGSHRVRVSRASDSRAR